MKTLKGDLDVLKQPEKNEEENENLFKNMGKGRCSSKILKIKPQKDITTYMYRAYPICILLAYGDQYQNWYNENMIQICAQIYSGDYVMMDYMEECNYYSNVLSTFSTGYKKMNEVGDIVEFIIEKIDSEWYMCINLDEYYIKNSQMYMKNHFVHDTYLHGYDNRLKKFYGLGFDQNGIFSIKTYEYDEIKDAFESGKSYYKETAAHAENSAITVYKPRKYDSYPFKFIRFMNGLNNYLNSFGSRTSISYIYPPGRVNDGVEDIKIVYGIAAMREVLDRLHRIKNGDMLVDYRAIHLLAEHKRGMLQKIKFTAKYFEKELELSKQIEEYSKLSEAFETIRIKAFEMMNSDDASIRAKNLSQIIKSFTAEIENEVEILKYIYDFYYMFG